MSGKRCLARCLVAIAASDEEWSPIVLMRDEIIDDNARRAFLVENLDAFGNLLRPRLKRWFEGAEENA